MPALSTDRENMAETSQTWSVPLSDIRVDDAIREAVEETVSSGWWSMGPRVADFERAFVNFSGARHALAVSNGTTALQLALVATGCGPGDEVILPSLNFVAAANAIAHTGATPVFCDVRSADDLNLDPADVAAAITPATKALLVLHYGGHPAPMADVLDLADRRGLFVIEDAAHAPGAIWQGRSCGTIGRVGCFSFFSNKNLPVGEGGMIVTDDDDLAERMRLLRSHGMTSLTWDRHRGHASTYDVVALGFNFRLDEIRAAIGLVQLERLRSENARRARIVDRYTHGLADTKGITVPFAPDGRHEVKEGQTTPSHHLFVVVLPEGVRSDRVRSALHEERIQTSVHYPPIHRFTLYAQAGARRRLSITDDVATRLLTLPLFGHMREDQVDLVVDKVLDTI